jgi:putative transposase
MAFFKRQKSPISRRDFKDAHLVSAIRDVHFEDPEFGYRFISDER